MGALSSSDLAQVLKVYYPNGVPKDEIVRKCPTLALLPKDMEWAGSSTLIPIQWGAPQGASAAIANAIANKTGSKHAGFNVTTAEDFAVWGVTGKVIAQTRNDKGAFVRYLTTEMDAAMQSLRLSTYHSLFRNGGGAIGRISSVSNVATDTITLDNRYDCIYFSAGLTVQASATDGTSGSVLGGGAGKAVIVAVDAQAGTLKTTAAWNSLITAPITNTSYLFRDGDFGAKFVGFDGWVPPSAPTSASFYGVDRSVDTVKLGGVRLPSTSADKPLDETLIDLVREVSSAGGTPDLISLHDTQWTSLEKRLMGKVIYGEKTVDTGNGKFGIRTIVLKGPYGDVDVIGDTNAKIDTALCLQTDTWTMGSMGELWQMLDDDGMPFLREALADAVEGRLVSRPGLACKAPGWNGRALLSTSGL